MTNENGLDRSEAYTNTSESSDRSFDSQQLSSIVHSIIDSYWDMELPSGKIKFSTGHSSMLGYESAEFAPDFNNFRNLVHPDDLPSVEKSFQNFLNGDQEYYREDFRLKTKCGNYVWVHSRAIISERDSEGRPTRIVGVHLDITDQQLLKQALHETSDAYEVLFVNNPVGVVLSHLSGEFIEVNKKFADFMGMEPKELIGHKSADKGLVLDVDRSVLLSRLKDKGYVEGHARVERQVDGMTLHLVYYARAITVNGNTVLLSIHNNVTDLVSSEVDRAVMKEKLRQNEAMLRVVLDTIPARVFWKDSELRYLGCNKAFATDAGYESPDDLIGKDDHQMGWHAQAEVYRADDQAVLESGKIIAGVVEPQTTPAGDKIWLRTTKVPLQDADGKITGVIGTYEDITESKKIEERLTKAEKMQALGLLAGGVAHDLNNMLGPLVGYPALMLHKLPPDSPLIDTVKRIERAAKDASEMVDDLLTLARRGRYEMKPTSLNDLVTNYMDSPHFLRITAENPEIQVKTRLNQSIPNINGSMVHLSKLIMNIVGNAFEAMKGSGEITIETNLIELNHLKSGYAELDPGSYVTLSIEDTGHGIAVEDRKKIFEPYFSRKQMGRSGSGLGLAVVYGVVKDHNAYYDVLSEVGSGTEFIFYFPHDVTSQESESEEIEACTGVTVLVVDDSAIASQQTRHMLRSLGHSVASVPNGREAVSYLKEHTVDLVVLDMLMEPDFDGLDTYREILKFRPDQKAIVVSGYAETDRVQELLRAGASSMLKKPLTMDALCAAVLDAIGKTH